MKRWLSAAYVCAVVLACAAGALLIPFVPSGVEAEKRAAAPFPRLLEAGALNLSFPVQYEDWLNDNAAGRNRWISINSSLMRWLGTSADAQVIVGSDGWLFFSETLPDYTGVGALSENQAYRLHNVLTQVDRALARSGVAFVVAIAPNKNTIYPDFMPATYPRAEQPSAVRRLAELGGLTFVDWTQVLAGRAGEGLYYRTDTHWNELGARYAARALLTSIAEVTGQALPLPDPGADRRIVRDYVGDLVQMLYPADPPLDERVYYDDVDERYRFVGRMRTLEDLTLTTAGGQAALSALVLRDSFGSALIPWLSNALDAVLYSRQMPLPLIDAGAYDLVVLEIAERRLHELIEDAPEIYAGPDASWREDWGDAPVQVFARETPEGVRVWGRADAGVHRLTRCAVEISGSAGAGRWLAYPVGPDSGEGTFSLLLEELAPGAQMRLQMEGDALVTTGWTAVNFQ